MGGASDGWTRLVNEKDAALKQLDKARGKLGELAKAFDPQRNQNMQDERRELQLVGMQLAS